jgi:tartrate dehydrogenase/decarboxylase/D-malate dehydrogenase
VSVRVAVIPGDGVGPEVIDVAVPVLRSALNRQGESLEITDLDWGGERFLRTGSAMPVDAAEIVRGTDAVLFGVVGRPDVPDHELVWGLIIGLRLDLAVNVRPVRAFPGVPTKVRDTDGVDLVIVRQNTEGEYVGAGGVAHAGTGHEKHPSVELEVVLVDAMAARMIQAPTSLDVLLAGNLFGDILSDLAAVLAGGMGMAPSANILPGGGVPGVYEPVHGSAPDIAGRGVANPVASILSCALLLEDLEFRQAARDIRTAVATALTDPQHHTRDLGGTATTADLATAVLRQMETA